MNSPSPADSAARIAGDLAAGEAPCQSDLESQIDHWLDDAIGQEWPAEGWCGRVAKHIAKGIRAERGDNMPKAVAEACEVVRVDAANTMQHDTTADLTPRLMCRVDARKLGLLLAWVDQFSGGSDE